MNPKHSIHPIVMLYGVQPDGQCACGDKVCKNVGKHRVFSESNTTPEMVASWESAVKRKISKLKNGNPVNFALQTGVATTLYPDSPHGVMVLDIDDEKLFNAYQILDELELGDGYRVRTARGWHYYYHAKQDIIHKRYKMLGFEIRNGSGYVVVEGSTHATGMIYQGNGKPVGHMPESLAEWIKEQKGTVSPKGAPDSRQATAHIDDITDANHLEYVQKVLENLPADEYFFWLKIGMALKSAGFPMSTWDTWSQKSSKYTSFEEISRKWKSFDRVSLGDSVSMGFVYKNEYASHKSYETYCLEMAALIEAAGMSTMTTHAVKAESVSYHKNPPLPLPTLDFFTSRGYLITGLKTSKIQESQYTEEIVQREYSATLAIVHASTGCVHQHYVRCVAGYKKADLAQGKETLVFQHKQADSFLDMLQRNGENAVFSKFFMDWIYANIPFMQGDTRQTAILAFNNGLWTAAQAQPLDVKKVATKTKIVATPRATSFERIDDELTIVQYVAKANVVQEEVSQVVPTPEERTMARLYAAAFENVARDKENRHVPWQTLELYKILNRLYRNPTETLPDAQRALVMLEGTQDTGKSRVILMFSSALRGATYKVDNFGALLAGDMGSVNPHRFARANLLFSNELVLTPTHNTRDLIKDFIYDNTRTVNRKFRTPLVIDTNFLCIFAGNTSATFEKSSLLFEHGTTNRRIAPFHSNVRLKEYLASDYPELLPYAEASIYKDFGHKTDDGEFVLNAGVIRAFLDLIADAGDSFDFTSAQWQEAESKKTMLEGKSTTFEGQIFNVCEDLTAGLTAEYCESTRIGERTLLEELTSDEKPSKPKNESGNATENESPHVLTRYKVDVSQLLPFVRRHYPRMALPKNQNIAAQIFIETLTRHKAWQESGLDARLVNLSGRRYVKFESRCVDD